MIKTGERVSVITVVVMATHVAPFYSYSMLYGHSIGIWLLGILLLWKPDRDFIIKLRR